MPDKWAQLAAQQKASPDAGTPAPTSDAWGDGSPSANCRSQAGKHLHLAAILSTPSAPMLRKRNPRARHEERSQHGTFDNVMHGLGRGFTETLARIR